MPNMNTYATNRLIIYLAISLLTGIQNQLMRIISGEFVLTSWPEYVVLVISIILPPIIVLRAFMDQSLSKNEKQQE